MRRLLTWTLGLLAACDGSAPQSSFRERVMGGPLTRDEAEKVRREMPLAGLTEACAAKLRSGGLAALDSVPLHECFVSTPPQRWRGLWRNNFEGSRFCPAPASECTDRPGGERIWLNVPGRFPLGGYRGPGGLYAVDFIGRRTVQPGLHGHLGMFNHEMTVERMMSIREVEPPPPPPTQAERDAETRRCLAASNCFTAQEWNDFQSSTEAR